jgi:hypothetical protein
MVLALLADLKDIQQINDANDNEILTLTPEGSAINYLDIQNAAAGNPVNLEALGDDTDIDILLTPKGDGMVLIDGADANSYYIGTIGGTPFLRFRDVSPANDPHLVFTNQTNILRIGSGSTSGTASLEINTNGGNILMRPGTIDHSAAGFVRHQIDGTLLFEQTIGVGDLPAHATTHVDGTDDIQDATAGQKGLATAAQITKLDAIEALADVTDEVNVRAALAALTADAIFNDDIDMDSNNIIDVNTIVGDGSGNFIIYGRDGDGGGPPSAGQNILIRGGAGTGGGADGSIYLANSAGGTQIQVTDTSITVNDAFFVLDDTDFDGNDLLDVDDIQVDSLSINKGAAILVNTDFDMQDNDIIDAGDISVTSLSSNSTPPATILLNDDLDVNGEVLIMDIDGDSFFYMPADDTFVLKLAGFDRWQYTEHKIRKYDSNLVGEADLTLEAGDGITVHGGDLYLYAGDSALATGGHVTIQPGISSTATDGSVLIKDADGNTRITVDGTGLITLGSNLDCNNNDLLNVDDVELNSLTAATTEIDVNDDIDMQTNDVLNAGNLMLSYSGISSIDNATAHVIAVAGTAVQVTTFDTNSPSANLTPDHTNDHITVDAAGDYLIMVSATVNSVAATPTRFEMTVQKNNGASVVGSLKCHRNLGGGGGEAGVISMSGIATLAASDTVEVWLENETNTDNYTVINIDLSMRRLDYA